MATRFLKLDLSSDARDFEPVALRLGVALLDREGVNYRAINKHLGRLIAEPEWNGDELSFYVSDETGARYHDIQCEPVGAKDLKAAKTLREDFESLKQRLQEHQAGSPLLATMLGHFDETASAAGTTQIGNHFYRYRDKSNQWRLVWCWGYQRRDKEPAEPKICTNPTCRQLFVRRRSGNRDCPGCVVERSSGSKKRWALVTLLFVLAAAGLGYWTSQRLKKDVPVPPISSSRQLVVIPPDWTAPAGSQLEYRVVRTSAGGEEEDVTASVVPVTEDPKVARFEKGTTTIHARSLGKTAVHFYLGDEEAHATVAVEAPRNPASIRLQPDSLTLGMGATADLILEGDFGDDRTVDLTEMAQWDPVDGASVSCNAGRLEGIAAGEATIIARYRATPDEPYLTTETMVRVVDEEYSKLEIAITPSTFTEGSAAELEISLVNQSGEKRSALNSSLLSVDVDDVSVATLDGNLLRGVQAGKGTVNVSFGDLSASSEFIVESDLSGRFVVSPKDMQLFVGEVAELDVVSGSPEAIHVVSSSPETVAVEGGMTVIGQSPGKATLTVTQEAREVKVEVEVKAPELKSLAFMPPRISVPVDRSVPIRLVGHTENDEQFDLSPEAVTWEQVPSAAIAELDPEKLELLGRAPTDSPETIVARAGGLGASGEVDVVPGPLRMVLTPEGPIELLSGQTATLHAWVRYGDGTRAEVDPSRIDWRAGPPDSSDLTFDPATATVRAIKSDGTLSVVGNYRGNTSNRVVINSSGDKFTLQLHPDRKVMMVGDQGRFRATVEGAPAGLSLSGVRFQSKVPGLLAIDRHTGEYRALAAGTVLVGVQHPNATNAAVESIEIVPRQDAELVLEPDSIKLLVNARQIVDAILVSGTMKETISLLARSRDTNVSIGQPDAVRWQPPVLIGLRPAEPFEISVEHAGKTARAVVEVLAEGGDLRVNPDHTRLSLGQAISPVVEQQVPGTDRWQEIDPAKITWDVPNELRWTAAKGTLRPRVTPSESAQGTLALTAKYNGKSAAMELEVANDGAPRGDLEVVREPLGDELPVGAQQRFAIMVQQGDNRVPAVGVQWQPPFENDYVRWDPPILVAKRPGHEQVLAASVGDEQISFATRTVAQPPDPMDTPPPPSGKPSAVRIVAEGSQPITLPVGSQFGAFRVEADYPGRPSVDVTREAALRASPGGEIAVVRGEVIGQKPGTAMLAAGYNGVATSDATHLRFNVIEDAALTGLSVSPQTHRMRVGENVTLRVTGYVGQGENRAAVGTVDALNDVQFQSDQPGVVRADGPTLTGLQAGAARITVAAGDVSAAVDVLVVPEDDSHQEPLVVLPRSLRLRVGESKLIGRDVVVRRGGADLSDQVDADSSAPEMVHFNRVDRSVEGITAGRASLALSAGGQTVTLPILVEPDDQPNEGSVQVEPDASKIAVGEYVDLRAFLLSSDGRRIDRTGSATFVSSDPTVLSIRRNRVTGVSAGNATVQARFAGIDEPGSAAFEVVSDEFTLLRFLPSPLSLGVGQRRTFQVQAVGPGGRRMLGDHPDLKFALSGPNPSAIELSGNQEIRGATPGEATLNVSWKGLQADPVPVRVVDQAITGLRIDPPAADVEVHGRRRVQVFATRGGAETVVTTDDGLQLSVDDPSLLAIDQNRSVRGLRPGSTSLTAQLGTHRAAAQVTVVPDSGRDRAADMPIGLRFIPDVLRLQLGVPGGTVRVVKVSRGGTVEDLDHRADFEITTPQGEEVVSIKWTASGPVFIAKKIGEADVLARSGDLTTRRPLHVMVVDPAAQQASNLGPARLQVSPDPLDIDAGTNGRFGRVRLVPADGPPVDVDYSVESNNNSVVSASGKELRGVSTGQARVTVRPLGVPPEFADVKADVAVNVGAPPPPTPKNSRLVLKGPSHGTAGAPLSFRAELVGDGASSDVTHEGASLVLSADQASIANVEPGCVLVPKDSGILEIKARYKDTVSNALTVAIDPPASELASLEIDVDRRPMVVGERRTYKLWGYPIGGGPRQNLTHRVNEEGTSDPVVRVRAEPSDDAGHAPPAVVANSPGVIGIRGEHKSLRSELVEIEVLDNQNENARLIAQPSVTTVRVGERTPKIQVLASPPGGEPRPVEVKWSSQDESVAARDPRAPGRFMGKRVGQTQLKATFGNQSTTVDVRVTGDPFKSVTVNEEPDFRPGNRFSVTIMVQSATSPDETLEYRVSTVGDADSGEWSQTVRGENQQFELSSPPLKRGPDDTTYHLMLEARNSQKQVVARYPLSFSLNPRIESRSTVEAKP